MVGELPFYRFFLDLKRQTKLSLTPYHLADLQRLILEKRPKKPEEVLFLCKILWLQNKETSTKFDFLFWEHWKNLKVALNRVLYIDENVKEKRSLEEDPQKNVKTPNPNESTIEVHETELEDSSILNPSFTNRIKADDPPPRNLRVYLNFNKTSNKSKKAIKNFKEPSSSILDHSFIFVPKYWPLQSRQLQQCWRSLRNGHQKVLDESINISATVKKIAIEGIIDRPVHNLKFSSNAHEIHILLDTSKSMTPYLGLTDYLLESITNALKPGKLEIFYFRKHPKKYLYFDKGFFNGLLINKWLRDLHKNSLIIIISDAGASNGEMDLGLINGIQTILKKLRIQTNRILWLNPVPRTRWYSNSAFYISVFVKMLGAERADLLRLPETLKKW